MTRREQREELAANIVASAKRVPTSPVDYARCCHRILKAHPTLGVGGLANKLGKHTAQEVFDFAKLLLDHPYVEAQTAKEGG